MPIIYALVARGTCVLAEYTGTSGNFTTVTRRILEKIPAQDDKMSYDYDRHYFHYIVDDGLTYMCMADQDFGRRKPFAFLEDIKNRFKSTYGNRGKTAIAYGMNTDFSRVLENQMKHFSSNTTDKIDRVRGEIDEVKTVMVQNIEKVLERGERIELLVDKTENLNQSAFKFKKSATQLKRNMWWKNFKITIILIVVVILIAYIVAAVACKGPAFQGCINKIKDSTHSSTSTTDSSSTSSSTTASATAATTGATTGGITTGGSTTGTAGTTGASTTTATAGDLAKHFTQTLKLQQQQQLSRSVAAQVASPEIVTPVLNAVKKVVGQGLSVRQ